MSRPLRINYSTSPRSLREMSDTDMRGIAHQILEEFTDGGGGSTGWLHVGATPSGGTSIGEFVDTRREGAPGDHTSNGTTITSTTTNFYQHTAVLSENPIYEQLPIDFDSGLNGVQEQSSTDINDHILRRTLTMMCSNSSTEGMGQYRLQPNAPSGGTWGAVAIITNRVRNAQLNFDTNTTSLWFRTAQSVTYPVVRPLKVVDNGADDDYLQEMTDAQIKSLVVKFRNRIISSGIGTYKLQTGSPTTGGTWIKRGLGFSDTRRQVADQNYTGNYGGFFAGSRTYSGTYTGAYAGSYTGNYAGPAYAGSYTGTAVVFYGGSPRYFQASYVGAYAAQYAGTYTGYYSGNYAGNRNYTANYGSVFSGDYAGSTVQTATESVSNKSLWMRIA